MAAAGSSPIDKAPEELREKIRACRARGLGATRIMRELGAELASCGIDHNTLQRWIYKGTKANPAADRLDTAAVTERLGRIADLLARSGIDPQDIGKVKAVRLSEWQGLTKDKDGEAHTHDLTGSSILLTPKWDEGPAWPVVQPAKPTVVRAVPNRKRATRDGWNSAVILPDIQFGYRRDIDTAELDPFHDDQALDVARQVVRRLRPDRIVLLGDALDLAEYSRFEQEPAFAMTTQASIDRAHLFLAQLRAAAGDECVIEYLEGNHDRRLQKSTIANAKASFGLRQAAPTPKDWPVLSVPHLLRLDDLGVKYLAGYPANITWLNDNLACVHGEKVRSTTSTAAAVIDDERVSIIFGHVHRVELQHKTRRVRAGAKFSFAASPGCLCRVDGAVPSTKGSTDALGRPITRPENWQQGIGVATYEEGDGRFALELVPIHNGAAVLRGAPILAEAA